MDALLKAGKEYVCIMHLHAEIPISKMETFIKNHEKQFNTFAIEYIKKIKQYKKFISNKYS